MTDASVRVLPEKDMPFSDGACTGARGEHMRLACEAPAKHKKWSHNGSRYTDAWGEQEHGEPKKNDSSSFSAAMVGRNKRKLP